MKSQIALNSVLISFILVIQLVMESTVMAQDKKGINFTSARSWNEVLAEAKKAKKIIFLYAYANSCDQCKKMDTDIYSKALIGEYANQNFISVKIPFEENGIDSEDVEIWKADGKIIMGRYAIDAFPTFLFIDPNGIMVHRSSGLHNTDTFLTLLKTANNTSDSYGGKIKKFKSGKLVGEEMMELSLQAKKFGQRDIAVRIANAYKKKVIDYIEPKDLLDPRQVLFLINYYELVSVNDRITKFMYENRMKSDSLLEIYGTNYKLMTDYIISQALIDPVIKPNGHYVSATPDWLNLQRTITKRYDLLTSERLIRNAKIEWFGNKKDWTSLIKYSIEKIECEGLDTAGLGSLAINNFVYYKIFQFSNDTVVLNKGANYMRAILKNNPSNYFWLDTYANILYKMKNKEEAIMYEENAIGIARKRKDLNVLKVLEDALRKMKKDLPTWNESQVVN